MTRHWFSMFRSGTHNKSRRPEVYRPRIEPLEKREVPTTLPAGFSESNFAPGIANPTAMEFAPDGRLFVAQQTGELRVVKNGSLLTDPFVTVSTTPSGERGLLGIAFHPDFANNGLVYVYYTVPTAPIHNRVSRFTADPGNPDVALAGEQVILELDNLSGATNHNGGAIHFGLDGKLYIAVGENANPPLAQAPRFLLGKLLRINPDGSIPPDNPYAPSVRVRKEIWAMGFRNPFTFAVQPGTGRIYVNDVGSAGGGRREEVNELFKKGHYGWPTTEGYTTDPSFISPDFAYSPGFNGTNCAIAGGAFFNPPSTNYPATYVGKYFFQDLCGNWMSYLDPDAAVPANTVTSFASGITSGSPVDIKVGADGNIYYLIRGGGGIVRRITYTAPIPIPRLDTDSMNSTAAADVGSSPMPTTDVLSRPIVVSPLAADLVPAVETGGASQSPASVTRRIVRLDNALDQETTDPFG